MQRRGRRQSDQPGELDVGAVGVELQLLEQLRSIKSSEIAISRNITSRMRSTVKSSAGNGSAGAYRSVMKNRNAILALIAAGASGGHGRALQARARAGSTRAGCPPCGSSWRRRSSPCSGAAHCARRSAGTCSPGALGYGVVLLLQNAGIEHTSVSHAAIIVGACQSSSPSSAAGLGNGAHVAAHMGRLRGCARRGHARRKGWWRRRGLSGDMLVFGRWSCLGLHRGTTAAAEGTRRGCRDGCPVRRGSAASLPVALLSGGLPTHPPRRAGGRVRGVGAGRHGPVVLAVRLRPEGASRPSWRARS